MDTDSKGDIGEQVKKLTEKDIQVLILDGKIEIEGVLISSNEILIDRKFLPKYSKEKDFCSLSSSSCGLRISTVTNPDLMNAYYIREVLY